MKRTGQTLALPPSWDSLQEEETRYQKAEELRLLYVAATRAKELLVVSTYPKKPDKSPWHPLEQFLTDSEIAVDFIESAEVQNEEGKEPLERSMLNEFRENMVIAAKEMSSPTYARQSAASPGSEIKAPKRSTPGRGAAWGRVMHAALEALIKGMPQVELYRRSWQAIAGEKVVEAGLFFTDVLQYFKLPVDSA